MDSPTHSSNSDENDDEFAAILDEELGSVSDASLTDYVDDLVSQNDDERDTDLDLQRVKRHKAEKQDDLALTDFPVPTSGGLSTNKNECRHPGAFGRLCYLCGQLMDDESGVAVRSINKNLRVPIDEVSQLRDIDLKSLLNRKKLCLVIDLDHTVLNSAGISEITAEEGYLTSDMDSFPDIFKSSLKRLDRISMMTKLRPFVPTFLKEASTLFEMYINTMGQRSYALEMAKLLDPEDIYFNSKIIAQEDSTTGHQKDLDVVSGKESAVLILDDTEAVWSNHMDNLMVMERYHFFAANRRRHGLNGQSLAELKSDESETEGALATVLKILQQIHGLFFDPNRKDNLFYRDVRQVLKTVREDVLKGCRVVFSGVFPTNSPPEQQRIWKMAEKLGATCSTKTDSYVTHVVSLDTGTEKSRWAVKENKFLVNPGWIEASSYLWRKQPEDKFPVTCHANKRRK